MSPEIAGRDASTPERRGRQAWGPSLRALFSLSLLWCTAAVAGPDTCLDLSNQPSMNLCEARRFAKADKALNDAYEALRSRVSDGNRPILEDLQGKSTAFRDAQCAFDTLGSEGGSIHPTVVFQCLTDLTEGQTRLLDAQLHCQEGDAGCGGQ